MPEQHIYRKTDGPLMWERLNGDIRGASYGVVAVEKRDRIWTRQPQPHIATLPYSDLMFYQSNSESDYYMRDYLPAKLQYTGYPQGTNHESEWLGFCLQENASLGIDKAKLNVLEKVSEDHWDAPVWAAELGETTQMIADTARTLAKAGSQFRNRQFKKCAETLGVPMQGLKGPKDNWMSYRYGWIPAINDCVDMARTFGSAVNEHEDVRRFFAAPSSTTSGVTSRFWFGGTCRKTVTQYKSSLRCAAWLKLRRAYPTLIALESFGLVNWPANAYNLVPLSWVVDWVYPIGDYLQAQTALLGYEVLDGGESRLATLSGSTFALPNSDEIGYMGNAQFHGRSYERTHWSGEISLFPPKPNLSMHWKRCLDAASLLHNVFGPITKR